MSKENAANAAESLRSKRKFGKKGMVPAMKLLSKPEGTGTPSAFDGYGSDDADIDEIFKVQKTEKTKKAVKGKGLSATGQRKGRHPRAASLRRKARRERA